MTLTAKYPGRCSSCGKSISVGDQIEWAKGTPARHTACAAGSSAKSRNWDPNAFAGHGRPRGGYRKACVTGGNCSSFGSGRSCGGHDCDGH